MDLFEKAFAEKAARGAPLADRMRPRTLAEFVGQEHLLAPGKILHRLIDAGEIPSMIFWGPPGCGKTSLARLLALTPGYRFLTFSAVLSGVKEVREAIEAARLQREMNGARTILFVDEIHRFNKAQQDAFLKPVEEGLLVLIGATTENPSFEINSPLLSRCRILNLFPLTDDEIRRVLAQAAADAERGLGGWGVDVPGEILSVLAHGARGDARAALTALEVAAVSARRRGGAPPAVTEEDVREAFQTKRLAYDKAGDEHYNVVSAFIKSLRGSDPDAALYWMARMLEAGEDPHFILRRMVIFASEDVGNAEPQALVVATAALAAFDCVGLPEGWIPMAQAAVFLAAAPKSNAAYKGYLAAKADVAAHGALPVPAHIRHSPKGYKNPHDFPGHHVPQPYLPDALRGARYYVPSDQGYDQKIAAFLARLRVGAAPAKARDAACGGA